MPIYSGSLPYSPNPVPYVASELPRYLSAELDRIANILADFGAMKWTGDYVTGQCYDRGMVVSHLGYAMVALVNTCDEPLAASPDWDVVASP